MQLFYKNKKKNCFKKTFRANLNCNQLIHCNIVLGHSIKEYKRNIAKYFLAIYNNNIIFNHFWSFSVLKKNLLFLINIFLKNHLICLFTSNGDFILRKKIMYRHRIIMISNEKWPKGLLTNFKTYWDDKIFIVNKHKKKLFLPTFIFINNWFTKDLNGTLNEIKRLSFPSAIVVDSNIVYYNNNINNILYLIPGSDNSGAFSAYYYKLAIKSKIHSSILLKNKIIHYLKY